MSWLLATFLGGCVVVVADITGPHTTDDGFTATLDSKGGVDVRLGTDNGTVLYRVSSSFSEPGPVIHRFGRLSGSHRQGWLQLAPTSTSPREGITGRAKDFTVRRTISVRGYAILINDTVRALPDAKAPVVGMEVNHLLEVVGGQQLREATVPGAPWTFGCNSLNPDSVSGRSLHRGTAGNPTIHLRSDGGGIGMLPLDDVFEVHAWSNNSAVPRFPRMPATATGNPRTKAPFMPAYKDCPVTKPPSVGLTDNYFALARGDEYTMEWALYPGNSSCSDYFCFINRLRDDLEVSTLTLVGTGSLGSMSMRRMHEPMLSNAGYGLGMPSTRQAPATFEDFSDRQFVQLLDHQAMHFVVNTIPFGNYTAECPGAERRCYGSCFTNTLDAYSESEMRLLINRTHTLAPERPVLLYTEFALSTEPNASILYKDSQWLNASGVQIAYETCAMNRQKTGPGRDYNLFFGNSTNSYGKQLELMVQKVMRLGFDGIYHDDFMVEGTSYTFGTWDNHSAILDPITKSVTQTMASIPLLIQDHAIRTMQMVKSAGGVVVCNGQPLTRTVREWAARGQQAGGRGGASLHFIENSVSEAHRQRTHLFTPLSLLRYGGSGDLYDLDPLYNSTCSKGREAYYSGHGEGLGGSFNLSSCVGKNINDHLDFGVLPFLYDGLFYNSSTPTILTEMFPITAHRIGRGLIEGKERIITKISGSYLLPTLPAGGLLIVFIYTDGLLVRHFYAVNPVQVQLARDEVAIIRAKSQNDQNMSAVQAEGALLLATKTDDVSSHVHQAFLPLWNSAFNATAINGKPEHRPHCTGDLGLSAFKIGSNSATGSDGGYNGNTVATLHYDFGMTGLVPYFTSAGVAVNGGLPQLMNMSAHLAQWQRDIERQFPDPSSSAVVSLDWEAWWPLEELNLADPRLMIYVNMSRALVRQRQPSLKPAQVVAVAKTEWESAVKELFLQTLRVAKELRPLASWGWYDYPACSWGRGPDMCKGGGTTLNTQLDWLWQEVDHFAPSVYLCSQATCSSHTTAENAAIVNETMRGMAKLSERLFGSSSKDKRPPALYPYVWYEYYDTEPAGTTGRPVAFLSKADINTSFLLPAQWGAAGVTIWGANSDGRTSALCHGLETYVRGTFGPAVLEVVESRQRCSQLHCSGRGRCSELVKSSGCQCFAGFSGKACESTLG